MKRPRIVCLCGSVRFSDAFREANFRETLAGNIVLSIGCNMKSDHDFFGHLSADELEQIKRELDELHLRKIDLADEVLVLNVGGYIGSSTRREVMYAIQTDKTIRWLEPMAEHSITADELHNRAMDLAEQGFRAQHKGKKAGAAKFFRQALALEQWAANRLDARADYEPTRSILYRSAASLAHNAGDLEAERYLIRQGLAGFPPPEIRYELEAMLGDIT